MRYTRLLSSLKRLPTRVHVLEAERKFKPDAFSLKNLVDNAGKPRFPCLTRLADTTFEDIYYDSCNALARNGIWVRMRDGVWEAKHRHAGDYMNSHFEELSGRSDVAKLLLQHLPQAKIGPGDASGLEVVAKFKTHRRSWLANGRYTIVIDDTDFGHQVGEVELVQSCSDVQYAEKGQLTARMHDELNQFMKEYRWAFPTSEASGKLSAYFKLHRLEE